GQDEQGDERRAAAGDGLVSEMPQRHGGRPPRPHRVPPPPPPGERARPRGGEEKRGAVQGKKRSPGLPHRPPKDTPHPARAKAVPEPRPSDVRMTDERYQSISLFKNLKAKISLDKYPGTVVVRRYRKGEVICRQGEAGWTAFYILTTEDMYQLGLSQLRSAET